MTEERRPSDTHPIDREELEKHLAAARADLPDPDPTIPEDEPTSPQLDPLVPPCPGCKGKKMNITRSWDAHGRETMQAKRCPVCCGSGTMPAIPTEEDSRP